MLILIKLLGDPYPQITQAPTTTYVDFLNFFRGGHTIDDNVDAPAIAGTLAAAMLKSGVASGHLAKRRNRAIPDETLADISLTKSGCQLIQATWIRNSANWQLLKLERASLRMMANCTQVWAWSSLRTENFWRPGIAANRGPEITANIAL